MQTGFVYLWRDNKKNKYCLGAHWGTEDDGYITSTGHMTKAYKRRPQDFKRRILYRHYGDRPSLFEVEQKWLDLIPEEELGRKYYNYKKKASGQDPKIAAAVMQKRWADPKNKKALSDMMKGNDHYKNRKIFNTGRKWITNGIDNKLLISDEELPKGWSYGKTQKSDGWTDERRAAMSKRMKGNTVNIGRILTEETKQKISRSSRALNREQSNYQRQRASEAAKNRVFTEDAIDKIRQAAIEREAKKPIVTCPHCDKSGKGVTMYRWHFDNCREARL